MKLLETNTKYTVSLFHRGFRSLVFFIKLLKSKITREVGNRYFLEQKFNVHYFPLGPSKNQEILDAVDKLNMALEYVTDLDGNVYFGSKISYEIVDEILHFFIEYDFFGFKNQMTLIDGRP